MVKRLRWLIPLLLVLLCPAAARAQYLPAAGWCEDGNKVATTSGIDSTNTVQASYSECMVTVVIHGGGAATIYSNATGTPLANPFTANTNGQWQFFALPGILYDVTISGGTPVMPGPVTFSSTIIPGTATGTVTSFSSGNLSPIFTTSVATATTTPALSFSLSTAAAYTVLANCTGSTAAPTYCALVNAMMPAPGSTTQVITNVSGLFGASQDFLFDPATFTMSVKRSGTNAIRLVGAAAGAEVHFGTGTTPVIKDVTGWEFTSKASQDFNFGPASDTTAILFGGGGAEAIGTARAGVGSHPGIFRLNDGTSGAGIFLGPTLLAGTASPEASITARIGSLFMRADGSTTTALYLKETGTGNTGWAQFAMQDDTQTITNKSLTDTTTYIVNTSTPTQRANFNLAGSSPNTTATLTFATTVDRAYTFPNASGTICLSGGTCTDYPTLVDCGTTTTCANTATTSGRVIIGAVALSSGTPSTATVTGISPAFTSTATYRCAITEATTATNNLLKIVNTSSSSFTITGPNTLTDTISYVCAGY